MLDSLNSAACFVLMLYMLPLAMLMQHTGQWLERVVAALVIVALMLQVVNPWAEWLPTETWPASFLHVSCAIMVSIRWRELWLFSRAKFAPEAKHPLRRVSDVPALHQDSLSHVRGGKH